MSTRDTGPCDPLPKSSPTLCADPHGNNRIKVGPPGDSLRVYVSTDSTIISDGIELIEAGGSFVLWPTDDDKLMEMSLNRNQLEISTTDQPIGDNDEEIEISTANQPMGDNDEDTESSPYLLPIEGSEEPMNVPKIVSECVSDTLAQVESTLPDSKVVPLSELVANDPRLHQACPMSRDDIKAIGDVVANQLMEIQLEDFDIEDPAQVRKRIVADVEAKLKSEYEGSPMWKSSQRPGM